MIYVKQFLFVTALLLSSCSFKKQDAPNGIRNVNGMGFSSLELKNGLEVLVVSDPRFKKSSAAMAVMVGSMENPADAEGLAHYLEHMLFLGTKEHPSHDDYGKYMETHGGWDNAYTSDEETNYHFEVDHAAMEGGLERFSRFFVSPTFDETFLDREKNAVVSEFQKNLKSDNWRTNRYMSLLSRKDHPHRLFTTGNTQTLAKVNRDTVIGFYKKHYSANNMKLVIMGAEPVDKLRGWAQKYFSDIPNFKAVTPKYDDDYFVKDEKDRLHFIKTIDDGEGLLMIFNTPDEVPYWKSKPGHILARLLGDEGKGSLLSYLKDKGWVLNLQAGDVSWRTFGLDMDLTTEGRKHYKDVVAAVFSYIELMKKQGYPKYIYEDEKAMRKIEFDNLEPSASGNHAAFFAKSMTNYPVKEFLDRFFLLHDYSEGDFNKFLKYLNVDNLHIIVGSKHEVTDKKEDIFGIQYKKEEIPQDLMARIKTPEAIAFTYPEKNKYIPNDFSLVSKRDRGVEQRKDLKDGNVAYTLQDTELGFAKGNYSIRFISAVENSPRNYLMGFLFSSCKDEELREWSAPILEARVDYGLSPMYGDTMTFSVGGYSHRLMATAKDLIWDQPNHRRLDRCSISESLFSKIKEKLKKDLANKDEDVAYQRLREEIMMITVNKAIHWRDVIPLVDKVSLKDVQDYGNEFFKKAYIEVMAYGNITPEQGPELVEFIVKSLGTVGLDKAVLQSKWRLFRSVPEGKEYSMLVKGKNNNFAMATSYNLGPWNVADHARVVMLSQMISQPYYSELRTTRQLGYVVSASPTFNRGFIGINALIQSPKHDSLDLENQSDKYLKGLLKEKMETLTEEEVAPVQSSIVNELLTRPNTMGERAMQFRDAIMIYGEQFDIRKKIADEVGRLKAKDIKDFIKAKFFDAPPARLHFFYYGDKTKIPKKLPGKVFEKVSEIKEWKESDPYIKPEGAVH